VKSARIQNERVARAGSVISKELPGIRCRNIDLSLSPDRSNPPAKSFRNPHLIHISHRRIPRFRTAGLIFRSARVSDFFSRIKLRKKGAYLNHGGAGGSACSWQNAREASKAKLALLGRSEFPPESEWQRLAEDSTTAKSLRQKLQSSSNSARSVRGYRLVCRRCLVRQHPASCINCGISL